VTVILNEGDSAGTTGAASGSPVDAAPEPEKAMTRGRLVFIRFLRNKLALVGLVAPLGAYDRVARYRSYLSLRSGTYMQIESGASDPNLSPPPSELGGYDRIAASVVRAIHFNTRDIIPLSVVNRGTIADLLDSDVVEVPCVVDANGARALHVGHVPDRVRPLLQRVKEYERLTVGAALAQSLDAARAALAANPLVPDQAAADALVDDLAPLW